MNITKNSGVCAKEFTEVRCKSKLCGLYARGVEFVPRIIYSTMRVKRCKRMCELTIGESEDVKIRTVAEFAQDVW